MAPRRRKPYRDVTLDLWVAEVFLGVDGRGKRIRRRVTSKSHAGCVKKLEKLERELADGQVLAHAPERTLMKAWLERWLEDKTPHLEPNTEALYSSLIKRHLIPRIGATLLHKLTPLHLQSLFTSLERDGVGRRTQQNLHALLKQILSAAVNVELLAKSPMLKVAKPPLDQGKRKPRMTWTVDDARKFLVHASTHRWSALFVLAVATAMRQSEIFGLLWENVDVERGFLRVEWALHEVRKGSQKKVDPRTGVTLALRPPKTLKSRRVIALPVVALDALKAQKKTAPKASPFVFTTVAGEPVRGRYFADEWQAFLDETKLPRLPFGRLRHTCLTLLAEEGVALKAAQELAGHSTSALTANIYQAATARLARQAADAIDRALGPASKSDVVAHVVPAGWEPSPTDTETESDDN